jgi:hypothetical protein
MLTFPFMEVATMSRTRILTAAALAALFVSAASAQQQQQQGQRLSGTIERVEGNTVYAKASDGGAITLKLADNATVTAVLKATLADIKPGAYIGSGAVPQPDGTQKAVEVHIFAKPQADGGHHYDGWYGAPNGTMTNGFVEPTGTVGAAVGGSEPSFMVKYAAGEKRIVVPANAHIVRTEPGGKDDLKPGAAFRVQAATKQTDGTYTASNINVGRDGARPF